MIPNEELKSQLKIYKTLVEQNMFQLLEISLRFDAMLINIPEATKGDVSVYLHTYLSRLRSTLSACEELLKAVNQRLAQIE